LRTAGLRWRTAYDDLLTIQGLAGVFLVGFSADQV